MIAVRRAVPRHEEADTAEDDRGERKSHEARAHPGCPGCVGFVEAGGWHFRLGRWRDAHEASISSDVADFAS